MRHYSISYKATPNATCDAAEPPTAGRFRESHIDVWVDATNHRARMRTIYPDGSTRNLVTFGDGPVPDRVFEQGDPRSELIGCGLHTGTFMDPGAASLIPDVGVAAQQSPRDTIVPGEHRDSLGRVAQVWTSPSPGSIDSPGLHVEETMSTSCSSTRHPINR